MKKIILFSVLLSLPFTLFVPKTLAYNQDWTVATDAVTDGPGPYGTNGDIVASGHCVLTLRNSYGGYEVDSTSLCDGNKTAYFSDTFPDGKFYLSYQDRDDVEHDSNYFTIQNGLIVNDNVTPDVKPAPNYQSSNFNAYGYQQDVFNNQETNALLTDLGTNSVDSIGTDVYNSNNQVAAHVIGEGNPGSGTELFLDNTLSDGVYYIYDYIFLGPDQDNNTLVYNTFYSNKFFIEGGQFYSDPVVISSIPDSTLNRGDTYQQDSSFIDVNPSATSWSGTVDYGDGSGPQTLLLNPDKTFSLNHQYNTVGTYTMIITVTNDQGDTATETATITVNPYVIQVNNPPFVNAVMGNTYAPTVSFTDPDSGATAWTATVDYGDGSGPQSVTVNPDNTLSLSHVYSTVGRYSLTITVNNNFGETGANVKVIQVAAPFSATNVSFDSLTNTLTFTSDTDWSKACLHGTRCGASTLNIYDGNNNPIFKDMWSPNSCRGNGVCTIQLSDFDASLLNSSQFSMVIQLYGNISVSGSSTNFTSSQLLPSDIFTQN